MREFVYAHVSTVGGAEMTLAAQKFGGFILNGSNGSTLSIYDGSTLIISTSAAAGVAIPVVFNSPIAMRNSLLATCSGTGFYSVLVTT